MQASLFQSGAETTPEEVEAVRDLRTGHTIEQKTLQGFLYIELCVEHYEPEADRECIIAGPAFEEGTNGIQSNFVWILPVRREGASISRRNFASDARRSSRVQGHDWGTCYFSSSCLTILYLCNLYSNDYNAVSTAVRSNIDILIPRAAAVYQIISKTPAMTCHHVPHYNLTTMDDSILVLLPLFIGKRCLFLVQFAHSSFSSQLVSDHSTSLLALCASHTETTRHLIEGQRWPRRFKQRRFYRR